MFSMKVAGLLKKAPGQFKNLHPCTESVPAVALFCRSGRSLRGFFFGLSWIGLRFIGIRLGRRPGSAHRPGLRPALWQI
jgi:hypothetical protein